MLRLLRRVRRDERGATAIEYGLIISLIVLAILGALTAFGAAGSNVINQTMIAVSDAIDG